MINSYSYIENCTDEKKDASDAERLLNKLGFSIVKFIHGVCKYKC